MKTTLVQIGIFISLFINISTNATNSYEFRKTTIDTIVTHIEDEEYLLDAKTVNLSNTTVTMVYRLISSNVPSGWIYTLCDSQKCNFPGTASGSGSSVLSITGNTQYFKLGVTPTTLLGIIELEYETYDALNPSNIQIVKFKLSTLPDQITKFSAASVTVGGVVGTSRLINIVSNTTWTISGIPTWLTANFTAGSNNNILRLTINQSNPNSTARNAVISITGPTTTTTLTIYQDNNFTTSFNDKITIENFILVYPNPVVNNETIYFSNRCDVELYNLFGNRILMKNSTMELSILGIQKGVYYLKINSNSMSKIIIE